MATKLFVGSLSWGVNDDQLQDFFAQVGKVISAKVITDRDTGRSKGFGFVEMEDEDAKKAIAELDGKELDGRAIAVNEARPREDRGDRGPRRSFGGGGNDRNGGGRRY